MKGTLVFDVDCGPASFLGHSQKWCVDTPSGRYHLESFIRRGVHLPDSPRVVKTTPCDKSCLKSNIPDEIWEMAKSQITDYIVGLFISCDILNLWMTSYP